MFIGCRHTRRPARRFWAQAFRACWRPGLRCRTWHTLELAALAGQTRPILSRSAVQCRGTASVPRTRAFSAGAVLRAYVRREAEVDRMILACFVLGLSTRKVGEALLPILGERVSAVTVSQVAKTLDGAVAGFHARPLKTRYRQLVLDGVVLARKTGAGAIRRPVLVALGLRPDGKKEVIDFRLAGSESDRMGALPHRPLPPRP